MAVETWQPPRVRLRFADDLPGHGLRVYRLAPGAAPPLEPTGSGDARRPAAPSIENAAWRVEVDAGGRVTLTSKAHGLRIDDALALVSEGDRGDEYNFDPVPGGVVVERLERVRVRILQRGAGRGGAARRGDASRAARSSRRRATRAASAASRSRSRSSCASPRVSIVSTSRSTIDNTARDHRLRLHCRAPFAPQRFEVESAFEIAERPIAPRARFVRLAATRRSSRSARYRSAASRRWSGSGGLALTVANRGVAEVEAVPSAGRARRAGADGAARRRLALARRPALRPGPAGPGLADAGRAGPGRHRAEFSLRLHRDGRSAARSRRRTASPFRRWHSPGVEDADGALVDGARLVAIDDPAGRRVGDRAARRRRRRAASR